MGNGFLGCRYEFSRLMAWEEDFKDSWLRDTGVYILHSWGALRERGVSGIGIQVVSSLKFPSLHVLAFRFIIEGIPSSLTVSEKAVIDQRPLSSSK